MKTFNTVLHETETELVVQKSRFITYLLPVRDETAAAEQLERIRKQHWDAAHHVPAWIFTSGAQKFSDDGEPGGTAGLPVLEALKHAGLENCMAVVVRYFGGIKLGTGGLVRAYGQAVREAIAAAEVHQVQTYDKLRISADYTQLGRLQAFLCQEAAVGVETAFTDSVDFSFYIRAEETDRFCAAVTDLTHGRCEARRAGEACLAVRGESIVKYDEEDDYAAVGR